MELNYLIIVMNLNCLMFW